MSINQISSTPDPNNSSPANDIASQVHSAENTAMNNLYQWAKTAMKNYPSKKYPNANAFNNAYQQERTNCSNELNQKIQSIGGSSGKAWSEINNTLKPYAVYNNYADQIQKSLNPIWNGKKAVIPPPGGSGGSIHNQIENLYEQADSLAEGASKDIDRTETQLSIIEQKMSGIEKEIANLEQKGSQAPAGSKTAKDLAALEQALKTLNADEKTVQEKISSLKQELSGVTGPGGTLDQLEALLDDSHPNQNDLSKATELLKGVEKVQVDIESALSSLPNLSKDFKVVDTDLSVLSRDIPNMPTVSKEVAKAKAAADEAATTEEAESSQYTQAEKNYQSLLQKYQAALKDVNACTNPQQKKVALKDLANAEKSLNAAKETLSKISTSLAAMKNQVAAANSAYQKATKAKTVAQASKDAAAAQSALGLVESEKTSINQALPSIANDEALASTSIQNALSSVTPAPPAPPPTPPSTAFPSPFKKDTVVDGVTVYQVTIPGYGLSTFPAGGNQQGQCTSEAMGMMLRYAINSKNSTLFHSLMNGYGYLSSKGIGDGLIPWSYKVENGSISILDKGSALDADIMSVGEMIKGAQLFGSYTLGNGQPLDTLIKQAINGLAKDDIVGGNTYAPGNHWGGTQTVWNNPQGKYYDYVDFINVQRILNFCKNNNMPTEMNKITSATNQYINYELSHVKEIATTGGGDNNASLVRTLIYLGLFVSDSKNKASPFYANLAKLLDQVVTQATEAKTLSVTYSPHPSWFGNNGVKILGDHAQFATIGAYLLALNALSKSGYKKILNQSIDSLTKTGVAILNSYLKNGDDGNSIISQLSSSIKNKQQWSNGVYFNYMMFTECWPALSTIPGVKA